MIAMLLTYQRDDPDVLQIKSGPSEEPDQFFPEELLRWIGVQYPPSTITDTLVDHRKYRSKLDPEGKAYTSIDSRKTTSSTRIFLLHGHER
jgi:hypothetical protein